LFSFVSPGSLFPGFSSILVSFNMKQVLLNDPSPTLPLEGREALYRPILHGYLLKLHFQNFSTNSLGISGRASPSHSREGPGRGH
jgi:hypothetical protein